MGSKQVLVYGLLELTNDLGSIFVGHIHFKKLMKFQKFLGIFQYCWPDSETRQKVSFNLLRKENKGQRNFKKHFKLHKFSEIFYCRMSRLKNTILSVFLQFQYTRSIVNLRNKSMRQSLFKKHWKFQNFDEIFYCGMARLRNTNLNIFIQFQ